MITFWQKSKLNKDTYCECKQAKAEYFQQDGGNYQPIAGLPVDIMPLNVQHDEEPLVIPTMNESEKTKTTEQSEPLAMPSVI